MHEAASIPVALLLVAAVFCCVIGFAWLGLSLDSHWQQVRGNQPRPKAAPSILRALGSLALLGALVLCFLADHPSMAALVWVMSLAAAALLVAFTFTWQPRLFAPLIAWVR